MSDLTISDNLPLSRHEVGGARDSGKDKGFGDFIQGAIENVSDMETEADQSVQQLMKGQTGIHETMISLQKADISLRLLLQVRNKALEAYREVMRMQF